MTDNEQATSVASTDDHGEHQLGHVVPVKFLVGILLALLGLTVLTVAVTYLPSLGSTADICIALGIAFVKATLVALFFMHLYWDKPFNLFILVGSLFFASLFLGFCMMDTREYHHTRDPVAPAVQEAMDAAKAKQHAAESDGH